MTDRHLTLAEPPDDGRPPERPNDPAAERAVLGAMLTSRQAIDDVTLVLTGNDYYRPAHELIHDTITRLFARLEPVDPITVADQLTKTKDLARVGGHAYLHQLVAGVVTTANADYHARIVRQHAERRRLADLGTRLRAAAEQPLDTPLEDILDQTRVELDQIPLGVPGVDRTDNVPGLPIDDFLGADQDDAYDWLVPDFLERTDRIIVTAPEGVGKSTLLRQWGVQVAAGIHPVSGADAPPAKVLILDLENSKRQTRRKLRPLHAKVAGRLNPDNLIVHCKTEGLDLTTREDTTWLDRLLAAHRPDLLITGPIYKMAGGNPNDEQDAKPAALTIDAMRARHGIAVVLEAHSRKGEGGKHRPKEPFGWSGWMRWPEFGIHLGDDGAITHWRGMRDERTFPHQVNKGGEWPWTPMTNLHEQRLQEIKDATREAGRKMSVREYGKATGIPHAAVQRIVHDHGLEIEQAAYGLDGGVA